MPITLNIDCTLIPKNRLREAAKKGGVGKYLDLVLFEYKDGPDERGNAGFVSVSVSKEEREAGTRGGIIGNWKHVGGNKPTPAQRQTAKPAPRAADPDLDADQDSVPF